ncbi:two-component system sensor histidine kinase NtrB [Nevskia sp.]|uniref:two-component system sensor histidine kinase NtrB n=1 Tax=Nevskia sp. TaxID=1929292 RepID=UPI003F72DCE5
MNVGAAAVAVGAGSAEARIAALEQQVRERDAELLMNQQQMSAVYGYLLGLYEVIPGALLTLSPRGEITRTNREFHSLLGIRAGSSIHRSLARFWPTAPAFIERCLAARDALHRAEDRWQSRDGASIPVLLSASCQRDEAGEPLAILVVAIDLREQRKLEMELRQAQKLESLGQLAAGIAHEINTPLQFVGDNLHFIHESFDALGKVVDAGRALRDGQLAAERFDAALADADVDYLRQRVPRAIGRSIEGVHRVAAIVDAMKRFSHPRSELAEVDINASLADALTVAHNQYKYVADVVTDYGELPRVIAHGGDLNQVFLNLLVNAAHAIEARGDGQRGTITVRTAAVDGQVQIDIGDTGTGIPEAIRQRVFDPFFTTKAVGKGTGQGLAIARSVIVERHHGGLDFTTEVGTGTTFTIRLPVAGPGEPGAATEAGAP